MCEWVIARLGEVIERDVEENISVSGYFIFQAIFRCMFRGFLSIKIEIIGGKIPNVEQVMRKNSR